MQMPSTLEPYPNRLRKYSCWSREAILGQNNYYKKAEKCTDFELLQENMHLNKSIIGFYFIFVEKKKYIESHVKKKISAFPMFVVTRKEHIMSLYSHIYENYMNSFKIFKNQQVNFMSPFLRVRK